MHSCYHITCTITKSSYPSPPCCERGGGGDGTRRVPNGDASRPPQRTRLAMPTRVWTTRRRSLIVPIRRWVSQTLTHGNHLQPLALCPVDHVGNHDVCCVGNRFVMKNYMRRCCSK